MARLFSKYTGTGLAMLFAAGLTSAVRAQECPPLTKLAGVKLETLANSKRVLVPVAINNVPKKFLLDTAGMSAFITKESADDLKLEKITGARNVRLIKTFGLGGRTYEMPNTQASDSALLAPEYAVSSDRDGDIDGTLTNSFLLTKGELDIDFPGGTLNLFSPNHCPGKVNYWGAPDLGYLPLSYSRIADGKDIVMPTAVADYGVKNDIAHLTVPVTLDGHALNAWIDTSAEKSSISIEVAERIFNLPEKDLGPSSEVKVTPEAALGFYNPHILSNRYVIMTASSDVRRAKGYYHKFSGLTLGHVAIKNLELLVIPDAWGRNNDVTRLLLYAPKDIPRVTWMNDNVGMGLKRDLSALHSNARKDVPDMVLGMDVLSHLHIYLALKEDRMYFSVGGAPPAPARAATAQ